MRWRNTPANGAFSGVQRIGRGSLLVAGAALCSGRPHLEALGRGHLACFDENTVLAFFASPRESGVAQRVDAHAADCKRCRDFLAAYAALSPADPADAKVVPTAASLSLAAPSSAAIDDSLAHRLAHAQAARRIGQTFAGKWRIDRLLGVGGMAQVFAATHRNGKPVAIKLMRPELAVESTLVQRFLREAYAANRVAHPGAVAVHDDAATDDGVPFLVMDLLEGRTLRERLTDDGVLGVPEAARVIDQVLDVLAAAHGKGIVHRDIKPENLFESADGVRVLDFGIARLMTPGEGMTASGITMGTVGYMPPEQARGQTASVDARSDLWAVGATFFTLLTGRAVHKASTHNEALLLAMTAFVPPVRSTAPQIPVAVAKVIDKALAFAASERWSRASEMQAALRAALQAEPAEDAPAENELDMSAWRPRRTLGTWGIAVALAAVSALVAIGVLRAQPTPVPVTSSTSSAPASSPIATLPPSVPPPPRSTIRVVTGPIDVSPTPAATATARAPSTPPPRPRSPSMEATPAPPKPATAVTIPPATTTHPPSLDPLGPRT